MIKLLSRVRRGTAGICWVVEMKIENTAKIESGNGGLELEIWFDPYT